MKKYLSCQDVAEMLGVNVKTIWRWIKAKRLPALKVWKGYRIAVEDLEAFEQDRRTCK